ncbi:rho GDP dissociation inhibitor [Taxawa tesnikishii (nom. ined.)]|nr:rho GDP dissociation inhibitor [Dothideales sp. JES 119]
MSNVPAEDELVPEQTEGFKVGEKKTIDEYQQLGEPASLSYIPSEGSVAQSCIALAQ